MALLQRTLSSHPIMTRADKRKREMFHMLQFFGVEYRPDSTLCNDWVKRGKGGKNRNLEELIHRMCEAKYLHNYCNFPLGYRFAQASRQHRGHNFPQQEWFQVIKQCVLSTTKTGVFPTTWPWLSHIYPYEWKCYNDNTEALCPPY